MVDPKSEHSAQLLNMLTQAHFKMVIGYPKIVAQKQ